MKNIAYNKTKSQRWVYWKSILDLRRCSICEKLHGKIFPKNNAPKPESHAHRGCRCQIVPCDTILAGNATLKGVLGADWYIKYYGYLPDYYISKTEARALGWDNIKGNLAEVAPGKMIGGDVYYNVNGHLPSAPGRIWYEADINYVSGYRGDERLLYSNDGLIFVTYDHYETFIEIL